MTSKTPRKRIEKPIGFHLSIGQAAVVQHLLNEAIKNEPVHSTRCAYRKILAKIPGSGEIPNDDLDKNVQLFVAMLRELHTCFKFSSVELPLHQPFGSSSTNTGMLTLSRDEVELSFDVNCSTDVWEVDFSNVAQVTGLPLQEGAEVYRFLLEDPDMADLSGKSVPKVTKFSFKYSDNDSIRACVATHCDTTSNHTFDINIYGG